MVKWPTPVPRASTAADDLMARYDRQLRLASDRHRPRAGRFDKRHRRPLYQDLARTRDGIGNIPVLKRLPRACAGPSLSSAALHKRGFQPRSEDGRCARRHRRVGVPRRSRVPAHLQHAGIVGQNGAVKLLQPLGFGVGDQMLHQLPAETPALEVGAHEDGEFALACSPGRRSCAPRRAEHRLPWRWQRTPSRARSRSGSAGRETGATGWAARVKKRSRDRPA